MTREVVDDLLPHLRVRLDADELGAETLDVESRQRLRLPQLDVDRHEVDLLDAFGIEKIVQGDRRNLDFLGFLAVAFGKPAVARCDERVLLEARTSSRADSRRRTRRKEKNFVRGRYLM